MAQILQALAASFFHGLFTVLGCAMAKISINFVKNPPDVYDVAPAIKDNQKLLLQSMDNPALFGLAVRRLPQNYVVSDARVLGMSNIILNRDGYASLENICFNPNNTDKVIDNKEDSFTAEGKKIIFSSKSETSLDNAIFIGGHWNFGHWLFNHVARFCFIEEEMTHGATLLVPASLNANQLEILKYFRVAKSSIHLIKPGAIVNVGRLFVPQMPWHTISEFGTCGPWCFRTIAKKALFRLIKFNGSAEKIFLSREKIRLRRLVNEEELARDCNRSVLMLDRDFEHKRTI